MLLDFATYINLGGAIQDQPQFERLQLKAEALIGRITHGRIKSESPVRASVQYAALEIIDAMYHDAQSASDGREIASMSNDGISVTYVTSGNTASQERTNRYIGIARSYLESEIDINGTPLLYAGVDA